MRKSTYRENWSHFMSISVSCCLWWKLPSLCWLQPAEWLLNTQHNACFCLQMHCLADGGLTRTWQQHLSAYDEGEHIQWHITHRHFPDIYDIFTFMRHRRAESVTITLGGFLHFTVLSALNPPKLVPLNFCRGQSQGQLSICTHKATNFSSVVGI